MNTGKIACILFAGMGWFWMFYLLLIWPQGDGCLQQQAGYQAVVRTQTDLLQTQIDLLNKEKARAGLLQAAHTALQQELASTLAAKVGPIDDVYEVKVGGKFDRPAPWDRGTVEAKIRWKSSATSEPVESIEDRAVRMAPVEAAVKEVAEVEGGFIDVPWLKQQIMNSAKLAGVRWK